MRSWWKSIPRQLAVLAAIIAVTGIFSLGCASTFDLVREGTVTLDSISSRHAKISRVSVLQTDSKLRIYGELTRLPSASRMVPGYMQIELLDPQGALIAEAHESYQRKDKRHRRLWFLAELSVTAPVGSHLRIIHVPL